MRNVAIMCVCLLPFPPAPASLLQAVHVQLPSQPLLLDLSCDSSILCVCLGDACLFYNLVDLYTKVIRMIRHGVVYVCVCIQVVVTRFFLYSNSGRRDSDVLCEVA